MTTATVEWISTATRLPHDRAAVLGAITGRYPGAGFAMPGKEFWLVLPMHFRVIHLDEEAGIEIENSFVDPDDVVRQPLGGTTREQVTHWAEFPALPGTDVQEIIGDGVREALSAATD